MIQLVFFIFQITLIFNWKINDFISIFYLLEDLKKNAQGDMRIQIDAFENEGDEDHEEFLSRFDNVK